MRETSTVRQPKNVDSLNGMPAMTGNTNHPTFEARKRDGIPRSALSDKREPAPPATHLRLVDGYPRGHNPFGDDVDGVVDSYPRDRNPFDNDDTELADDYPLGLNPFGEDDTEAYVGPYVGPTCRGAGRDAGPLPDTADDPDAKCNLRKERPVAPPRASLRRGTTHVAREQQPDAKEMPSHGRSDRTTPDGPPCAAQPVQAGRQSNAGTLHKGADRQDGAAARHRQTPSAPRVPEIHSQPLHQRAVAPADDGEGLSSAITSLQNALLRCPAAPAKAGERVRLPRPRPHGDVRYLSPPTPLRIYSEDLYRALVPSVEGMGHPDAARIAKALAPLAQWAAADGYAALDAALLRDTLDGRLRGLPLETLSRLSRLAALDDKTRQKILRDVARRLGAKVQADSPKARRAQACLDIASALLDVVGEKCLEHARAMAWQRQVPVAIDAAGRDAAPELEAALRAMWDGDLILRDPAECRADSLVRILFSMPDAQRRALSKAFESARDAQQGDSPLELAVRRHLARLEPDLVVREQLLKYVRQLRNAARAMQGEAPVAAALTAHASDYLPPHGSIPKNGTFLGRLWGRIRSAFGGTPKTRDAVRTQTKQLIRHLAGGNGLNAGQLDEWNNATKRLTAKRGDEAQALVDQLIQDRLGKLDGDDLVALSATLEDLRRSTGRDEPLTDLERISRDFYSRVRCALEKEKAVRRASRAIATLADALSSRPKDLLSALDALADAEIDMPGHQSELELYAAGLRRLDPAVKRKLDKRLNGRKGISKYVDGIRRFIGSGPATWHHYRARQLDTLARAARA